MRRKFRRGSIRRSRRRRALVALLGGEEEICAKKPKRVVKRGWVCNSMEGKGGATLS